VGLVELSPDGKARLIPVAIMVDGKFYDATAYKASPVPLAIWGDTVYEGERTGVSQGLFTVREAVKTGNNTWFANGRWVPAGSTPAKKHTDSKPRLDEDSGPPKLRRSEKEQSAPPTTSPSSSPSSSAPPDAKTQPDSKTPADKNPSDAKSQPAPPSNSPGATTPPQSAQGSKPAEDEVSEKPIAPADTKANDEDPNRPVLVRGKIETLGSTQHGAPGKGGTNSAAAGKGASGSAKDSTKPGNNKTAQTKTGPQLIPAVSDAGGPEPRPYAYDLKSDEEQKIRKKMLAMAGELIAARAKPAVEVVPPTAKAATRIGTGRKTSAKPQQPTFDDVQFHAFDLWNTNEPVFILSATALMPRAPGSTSEAGADLTYYITLVTKQDIYGDLRKLNATVTDTRHLDETPRMELIDAVDADGDGRGELLFREFSDVGSVYAIYRAGADQLFPLFEGTR
jgi:hypothetical protein